MDSKIASLNDCEANKQLSEDAGGRFKLIQKARNLVRNSCIVVALMGHFRVGPSLCFKARLSAKLLI